MPTLEQRVIDLEIVRRHVRIRIGGRSAEEPIALRAKPQTGRIDDERARRERRLGR